MALPGGTGLAGDLLDAASDESVVLVRRADLDRLLAALGLAGDDDRVLEEMLTRRFPDLEQITLADGLTQQEVASRLGISQNRLSELESQPSQLTVERLLALTGILGLELAVQQRSQAPLSTSEW